MNEELLVDGSKKLRLFLIERDLIDQVEPYSITMVKSEAGDTPLAQIVIERKLGESREDFEKRSEENNRFIIQ